MKLLLETIFNNDLEYITEAKEGQPKVYRIKGVFGQAEVKNGNSRIYRRPLLESRVNEYVAKKVVTGQALGELNHRMSPFIDYERASHIVENMHMNGNDVIGVARILNSECGKTVKVLIDEGIKVGVSTRGLGTVDYQGYVNEDFHLCCVDIVSTPSAPKAILDAIVENKEYIINGDEILEARVEQLKSVSAYKSSSEIRKLLNEFLRGLK